MLTLKQISEISFRKSSFSGYKPEDVDEFIDEVTESYKTLSKENQTYKAKASELAAKNNELLEKLHILAEKVETYKNDEDGIKEALLSAQRMGATSIREANQKADDIVSQANRKADDMLEEAKKKSSDILDGYQEKIAAKERELDLIKHQVTKFRSSLFDMYRTHLSDIESIPDFSEEIVKKQAAEVKKEEKKIEEVKVNEMEKPFRVEEDIADTKPISFDDIEELDESTDELLEEYEKMSSEPEIDYTPDSVTSESFQEIDFDAYSDIPELLKNKNMDLFDTVEFGNKLDSKK